jgi:hypothetical protein
MDSINTEKLIEFSELFKNFATIGKTNENSYNLNSLIKASTIIKNTEIKDFKDESTGISLTGEEIWYMLIGNSMYNYEFVSKSGIAKYFNVALTLAQKTRCEEVVDDFCGYEITIANKSTIDSVTKLGDFQLSIHNFHSSPEVLFTNAKTYDDLKTKIKGDLTDEQFDKFISRRILFGDQYVPSYTTPNGDQLFEIERLNEYYLYSKFHHATQTGAAYKYNNVYSDIVKTFFKHINIRYSKNNYKQLIKLLRNFTYKVALKIDKTTPSFMTLPGSGDRMIDGQSRNVSFTGLLPNIGFVTYETYKNESINDGLGKIPGLNVQFQTTSNGPDIKNTTIVNNKNNQTVQTVNRYATNDSKKTEFTKEDTEFTEYKLSDIEDTAKEFFNEFAKLTFESCVGGLNGYLDKIYTLTDKDMNPDSDTSLLERTDEDDFKTDLKKSTYYNIKAMYDKISVNGINDSTELYVPTKISEFSALDATSIIDNIKLFYNYSINPNNCFSLTGLSETGYDLFEVFKVVDRGNNDIGTKILANLSDLYDTLYADFDNEPNTGQVDQSQSINNLTNSTFYKLFSNLASRNGFLYQQIPNYLNLNGAISATKNNEDDLYDIVDQLFGVHTDTNLIGYSDTKESGLTGFPGNIFQLGTEGSSLNDDYGTDYNLKNNNLNSFCLDVIESNGEIKISDEKAPDDIKQSNVTCFTVDFGTQNQQMFNSIQLDTQEFANTEESIKTWVNFVNDTQQTLQTTNLFPILEKRSYTCTVTSLGNATIQPLSYFYLRNVPLFYGTYWITNVMHQIQPNTMVTTFKGVRQPIASKIDVRKQLLTLLRKRAKELSEKIESVNTLQEEKIPNTEGDVYWVPQPDNESERVPYGKVIQKLSNGSKYYEFNVIDVLGAYIYSITQSNEVNNSNLGIIASIYNQANALYTKGGEIPNHYQTTIYVSDIVIGIMKDRVLLGDERYRLSNTLSLSRLINVSGSGYSKQSDLSTLLNEISKSETKYNDLMKLSNVDVFDLKLNPGIDNNALNNTVGFSMEGKANIELSKIDIKEAAFYFEQNDKLTKGNTIIDGVSAEKTGSQVVNTARVTDVFTSFNAANGSTINPNTEKDITIVTPGSTPVGEPPYGEPLTDTELINWMDFMSKSSSTAAKFALFVSDGTYDKARYEQYFIDNGTTVYADNIFSESDDLWKNVPKVGGYAARCVFDKLFTPDQIKNIVVDDPNDFDDVRYTLPSDAGLPGEKSYELGKDERAQFIADYRTVFKNKQEAWIRDNTKPETTAKTKIKVKFLGSFENGKVAFFGSKSNSQNYYKGLEWSTPTYKKYRLQDATQEQLNELYVAPTLGNEARSGFITSLVEILNTEKSNWESINSNQCQTDSKVSGLLTKYWEAVGINGPNCGTAWSAAFISYAVKTANPNPNDFKYSASHNDYIISARDGSTSWKAYKNGDQTNGVIQLGDILCHGAQGEQYTPVYRDLDDFKTGQPSHCDCVVKINQNADGTPTTATAVGGNVASKVGYWQIPLKSDGTIDATKSPYKSVILRFEGGSDGDTNSNANNNTNSSPNGSTNDGNNNGKFKRGSVKATLEETTSYLIDVLKGIGIPNPNSSQIQFMKSWRQHEGGTDINPSWNALNTTQPKPDSPHFNSATVRNYPDRQTGIDATIETLKNGRYNNVIEAIKNIKQDSDIDNAMIAVNNSPWGSKFNPTNHKYWKVLNHLIFKAPIVNL